MRLFALTLSVALSPVLLAADGPTPPAVSKEHEFLKAFAGEWESDCEFVTEPGKPPVKSKGTESAKSVGGFWLVSEIKGDFGGAPMVGQMTIGFDAKKKKYIGTWVCSMCDTMCRYEGTADGTTLTLETEMPDPVTGKLTKMKDVFELKDKDTKVLTSYAQGPDGKWIPFMTATGKRKK